MNLASLFLTSIVYLLLIRGIRTENLTNIGDCDIDKIHKSGPIIAILENGGFPTFYGRFSISNGLIIHCKTGNVAVNIQNILANGPVLKNEMLHLNSPYRRITSDELKLLALPANLDRINAAHNDIDHISFGKFNQFVF